MHKRNLRMQNTVYDHTRIRKENHMTQRTFPYSLDPTTIPTAVNVHVADGGIYYACPDVCWQEHLAAWSKSYRHGNKGAPQPMPLGHCMFDTPEVYGCVSYGVNDPARTRHAIENTVRGNLHGWDRDLDETTREKIVAATVDTYLRGENPGAWPFMACIYASI